MNSSHPESSQVPDPAGSEINAQVFQRPEDELLRSQLITENIPIGLFIYHLEDLADDRTLRMVYANPAVRRLTGLGPEDIVGKTLDENFPGLRAKGIPQRFAEVVRSQKVISFEDFTYGDGRVLLASFSVRAFPLPDNCVGIAFENITQRKQLEAAASQSRMLLDAAQRIAHVGGWEWDNERKTMTWTEETYRIHGIRPDELAAGSPEHIVRSIACYDPEDRPVIEAAFRRCVEEGVAYDLELRLIRTDQQRIWVRTVAEAVKVGDRVVKAIGTIVDITESRRAEEAIRESEVRFRTLTSLAPVGIYLTDASGKCQFANERWLEMAGLRLQEALGDGWKNGLHPDDRNQVFASWQQMVDAKGRWGHEYRFQTPSGKDTWVFGVATAFHDIRGEVAGYIGVNTDITERRQAEENLATINRQLQDSDARYRSLFDESPVAFWEEDFSALQGYFSSLRAQGIIDLEAHFSSQPDELMKCLGMIEVISVNQATLRMYEAPDAASLLGDLSRVITPESLVAFRALMVALFRGAQTHSCEAKNRTLSGRTIHVLLQTSFLVSPANKLFRALISVIDISGRKRAEESLSLVARRAEALLELPRAADTLDEAAFMQRGQELAEELTGSRVAFIHFVNDDQETIELVTWSRATLKNYCKAAFDAHYPVSKAGIWADALRQRAPVVVNDYANHPGKRGLPEGHAHLERFISVPVIEGGQVRMLTGVGNKPELYSELDVETVRLIGETIWRIVSKKRMAGEARRQLAELQQWYEVMLGREERVLELKREADALRQRLGEPPRYAVELAGDQVANFSDAGQPS